MKAVHGLSNKISVNENNLIKESYPYVNKYLDRINEIKVYEQLSNMKNDFIIIPYKWEFKNNKMISVTNFYQSAITLHDTDICVNKMKSIIKIISKIHNLELLDVKTFNPKEFSEFFIKNTKKCLFDLYFIKNKVDLIITNYWSDNSKPVFSHNDLVKGNFINFKKGWKVIDFEYGMYNHYLFDYASFVSESLNKKRWNVFLNLLNLSSSELNKINDLILFQNYLWIYWASYMFEQTNEQVFIDIAKEKFENLK
ncbi:phosphotransferase family protein [Mesoplasma tabanidae]|uniref:Choline kinase n=1 Tax=Mesoplasma tabanidae TaxID=219745 RepID=A0A2K8P662_9MOLU|nr:phosphotransferase [Mesoplasma tabanidae]ATZ21620.1 choline kinase [Mesoplasma tabanidae]